MAETFVNKSALVVTPPVPLTEKQVNQVRADVARQLHADVDVVVVPPGFTVQILGSAPSLVDLPAVQIEDAVTRASILAELQELRKTVALAFGGATVTNSRVAK